MTTHYQWINFNNDYLLPRTFIENRIIFIRRYKTTLHINNVDNIDMSMVFDTEKEAINGLTNLETLFHQQNITCQIDFFNSDINTNHS